MYLTEDQKKEFMKEALREAQCAGEKGEVPIGAVIVLNGEIIGRGHNQREENQEAAAHAEMLAIREANHHLGNWRLEDCELFVTLEPCPMCSGAIVLSRIKKVYYGPADQKAGAAGTLMNLLQDDRLNHHTVVEKGVLEEESKVMLQTFFKKLRERKKQEKKERKRREENENGSNSI